MIGDEYWVQLGLKLVEVEGKPVANAKTANLELTVADAKTANGANRIGVAQTVEIEL